MLYIVLPVIVAGLWRRRLLRDRDDFWVKICGAERISSGGPPYEDAVPFARACIEAAPDRVLAVGGGVQNRIWLQSTSDIGGVPQVVREKSIGASYGDAFLAAVGVGDVSLDAIDGWNPVLETIRPERHEALDHGYRKFRAVYEQTKDLMRG